MLIEVLREVLNRRQLGPPAYRWRRERIATCPVCGHVARILDTVDFGRSCDKNVFLPSNGLTVDYLLCLDCGFCFAPDLHAWNPDEFKQRIYNEDYIKVDPDYEQKRPEISLYILEKLFGGSKDCIRHLDYGGGNGLLGRLMIARGWNSQSFDPFNKECTGANQGIFDLITTIEVFEHVADVNGLVASLNSHAHDETVILFTTLLSDNWINPHNQLDWWYAAPRNGHISLFSFKSLDLLLKKQGLRLHSLSPAIHIAYKKIPKWAANCIATDEFKTPNGMSSFT